ncbi:hypothetical protein J8273_6812 [Carpediemonas membranifera]|uniref:Uncharacterized protein n=1 Tax=Carpediemonas membranifera TaxID=201153 RepID=A0A8J6AQV6_9EUKA|nr:hypothetical protein J8273_6812 [Carpediemonas membranifera]|eukprot:KAG9391921.1 hypothetical protein J8273_6812 [Carpediemonas membranifera]
MKLWWASLLTCITVVTCSIIGVSPSVGHVESWPPTVCLVFDEIPTVSESMFGFDSAEAASFLKSSGMMISPTSFTDYANASSVVVDLAAMSVCFLFDSPPDPALFVIDLFSFTTTERGFGFTPASKLGYYCSSTCDFSDEIDPTPLELLSYLSSSSQMPASSLCYNSTSQEYVGTVQDIVHLLPGDSIEECSSATVLTMSDELLIQTHVEAGISVSSTLNDSFTYATLPFRTYIASPGVITSSYSVIPEIQYVEDIVEGPLFCSALGSGICTLLQDECWTDGTYEQFITCAESYFAPVTNPYIHLRQSTILGSAQHLDYDFDTTSLTSFAVSDAISVTISNVPDDSSLAGIRNDFVALIQTSGKVSHSWDFPWVEPDSSEDLSGDRFVEFVPRSMLSSTSDANSLSYYPAEGYDGFEVDNDPYAFASDARSSCDALNLCDPSSFSVSPSDGGGYILYCVKPILPTVSFSALAQDPPYKASSAVFSTKPLVATFTASPAAPYDFYTADLALSVETSADANVTISCDTGDTTKEIIAVPDGTVTRTTTLTLPTYYGRWRDRCLFDVPEPKLGGCAASIVSLGTDTLVVNTTVTNSGTLDGTFTGYVTVASAEGDFAATEQFDVAIEGSPLAAGVTVLSYSFAVPEDAAGFTATATCHLSAEFDDCWFQSGLDELNADASDTITRVVGTVEEDVGPIDSIAAAVMQLHTRVIATAVATVLAVLSPWLPDTTPDLVVVQVATGIGLGALGLASATVLGGALLALSWLKV